ncbi:MAG TPA: hypothetical protein VGO90_15675 [Chthoniobacteraceae bacterium]|nr:hypothetical protein [Chthoniobacteraceae bacterium]
MGLFDHLFKPKPDGGSEKGGESPAKHGPEPDGSPEHSLPAAPGRAAFLQPKGHVPRGPASQPETGANAAGHLRELKPAPFAERRPSARDQASEAVAGEDIVLTLADVLPRIPPHYLHVGTPDLKRELRFHIDRLSADIARGRAAVPLSMIAALCPDLFHSPITDAEDIEIRLPLQKLVEQIGRIRSRPRATPNMGFVRAPAPEPDAPPPVPLDPSPAPAPPVLPPLAATGPVRVEPPPTLTPATPETQAPDVLHPAPVLTPAPQVVPAPEPAAEPTSAAASPSAVSIAIKDEAPEAGADAEQIQLSLAAIFPSLPRELVVGTLPNVDENVRITLPFAPIEKQLASGRVEVSSGRFVAVLPPDLQRYFEAREGVKVPLPLEEIFQNLPVPPPAPNFAANHEPLSQPPSPRVELTPDAGGSQTELPPLPILEAIVAAQDEAPPPSPTPLMAAALGAEPPAPVITAGAPVPEPLLESVPSAATVPPLQITTEPQGAIGTPALTVEAPAVPEAIPPTVSEFNAVPQPATDPVNLGTQPTADAGDPPPDAVPEITPVVTATPSHQTLAPLPPILTVEAPVRDSVPILAPLNPPPAFVEAPAENASAPVPSGAVSADPSATPGPRPEPVVPVPSHGFRIFAPPPLQFAAATTGPELRPDSSVEVAQPTPSFEVPPPVLRQELAPSAGEPEGAHFVAPELKHEDSSISEPPPVQLVEPPPVELNTEPADPPAFASSPPPGEPPVPAEPPPLQEPVPESSAPPVLHGVSSVPEPSAIFALPTMRVPPPPLLRPLHIPPPPLIAETLVPAETSGAAAGQILRGVAFGGQSPSDREAVVLEMGVVPESPFHSPNPPPEPPSQAPVPFSSEPASQEPTAVAGHLTVSEAPPDNPPIEHSPVNDEPVSPPSEPDETTPEAAPPSDSPTAFLPSELAEIPPVEPAPDVEPRDFAPAPSYVPPAVESEPESAFAEPSAELAPPPVLPFPEPSGYQFTPIERPLGAVPQEPLQAIFMTEEPLDLPKISRFAAALPGIQACVIATREQAVTGGSLPEGFDIAALLGLAPRVGEAAGRLPIGALQHFTLYGDRYSVSFFERRGLSICAVHRARSFVPGVREKLVAIADELSAA